MASDLITDVDLAMPEIIAHLIDEIPTRPYQKGWSGTGVTRDLTCQGQIILPESELGSYCCGAVLELAWGLLDLFRKTDVLDPSDMRAFYEQTYERADLGYEKGGIGVAIADLGWGDLVDVEDAQCGDFAQLWDCRASDWEYTFGHAVAIIGQSHKYRSPAVTVWSSDNLENDGHGFDHWYYSHPRKGYEREWYVGRFDVEWLIDHLVESEVRSILSEF